MSCRAASEEGYSSACKAGLSRGCFLKILHDSVRADNNSALKRILEPEFLQNLTLLLMKQLIIAELHDKRAM